LILMAVLILFVKGKNEDGFRWHGQREPTG
jgi:hypothetical protein